MMASSATMRDLGQRLLIGLGAAAAAVMAIGYAFIAGGIAAPLGGDLGTFGRPPAGEARAVLLDDGRPAYLVTDVADDIVRAVDARVPVDAGAPGRLAVWCSDARYFLDPVDGAAFDLDGTRLAGTAAGQGLLVHPTRSGAEGITVGPNGQRAGHRDDLTAPVECPDGTVRHEPKQGETFDPSVAAEEEPPGWVWLEGTLAADGVEVRLCDGAEGACTTSASVAGIDPAQVPVPALAGHFLGRVRDDAIVDLQFVPAAGGSR